ncbi:hypothetical protein I601_1789 [Nocardioides dokdonensis FR1436]|uniref:Uncharacterized protein n=1 Tax=Nocardioides dokdonensis FR1436 TaxID=1300347 RepID=A0A1A9GKL9_9ACTN|nr:hypothetical protein [Nocardioides dokdonensis]ANH38220.1 hypothetical protein I601_1789 [Nocardioides dokdonensis FR1436]
MKKLIISLVAALVLLAPTAPSAAATHTHYGESAREVAAEIGCKRFDRNGGGALNKDSGVCWLKGKRVNVITFRGHRQQRDWNDGAKAALPSGHWWANGKGALVTARNGNKAAAKIGAKLLPGVLRHA